MRSLPELRANRYWFHVLKAMIDCGDLARLSGSAVKVYFVVKSHANHETGNSLPGLERISEKAGISISQVKRELISLEKFGYIAKSRVGRRNEYKLLEKIEIFDGAGQPAAIAHWNYVPGHMKSTLDDLKNILQTGDLAGAKIVLIERLQVNVNHLHDNAMNFNVQQFMNDLEKLPSDLREKVMLGWQSSKRSKNHE